MSHNPQRIPVPGLTRSFLRSRFLPVSAPCLIERHTETSRIRPSDGNTRVTCLSGYPPNTTASPTSHRVAPCDGADTRDRHMTRVPPFMTWLQSVPDDSMVYYKP